MDAKAVWGPLHERYNTAPLPILDKEAWHADVVELMQISNSTDDLCLQLEKRKQQRLNELITAINSVGGGEAWWFDLPGPRTPELGSLLCQLLHRPSIFIIAQIFQVMLEIDKEVHKRDCGQ